ncbi:MAG: ComF family protein [Actinomycetota bacterium]|nr:ComF family protein [Actinomycetota bacterium]
MFYNQAKHDLIDLLYPTYCVVCGSGGGHMVCGKCLSSIAATVEPSIFHRKGGVSDVRWIEPSFESARAAGAYMGTIKHLVLGLKNSASSCAEPLALLMVVAAGNDPAYISPDDVCFVPSTREKKRERGFNPAEILARRIAAHIGKPISGALCKARKTRDQDELSLSGRLTNLEGAFRVKGNLCPGSRVLLVDDVFTTGATVDACSRALLAGGAREVNVIVAARTPLLSK